METAKKSHSELAQKTFDELYKDIKTIFGKGKITTSKIVIMAPRVIKFIQEVGVVKKLSGQEKKELFFETIEQIVEDSNMEEEEKQQLNTFIQFTLPAIVDAIVYAYKSQAFQQIAKKTQGCVKNCLKK